MGATTIRFDEDMKSRVATLGAWVGKVGRIFMLDVAAGTDARAERTGGAGMRLLGASRVRAEAPLVPARAIRTAMLIAAVLFGVGLAGKMSRAQTPDRTATNLIAIEAAEKTLYSLSGRIEPGEVGAGRRAVLPDNIDQTDFERAVEAIARLGYVDALEVRSSRLSDLSALRQLPRLRSLVFVGMIGGSSDPGIRDAVFQVDRLGIRGFSFGWAGFTSDDYMWTMWAAMASARAPSDAATRYLDLGLLAGLTALQTLDLTRTKVGDVTPLADLTALRTLNLRLTQVRDVTPLARLIGLRALRLHTVAVSDVTPLAGLIALQLLDLAGTKIREVTSLAGLSA